MPDKKIMNLDSAVETAKFAKFAKGQSILESLPFTRQVKSFVQAQFHFGSFLSCFSCVSWFILAWYHPSSILRSRLSAFLRDPCPSVVIRCWMLDVGCFSVPSSQFAVSGFRSQHFLFLLSQFLNFQFSVPIRVHPCHPWLNCVF